MKKEMLLAALLLLALPFYAARIDTLRVHSSSMNKSIEVVVVVPNAALGVNAKVLPVIYLLHGCGDNARSWLSIKPDLPQIADAKEIIFVCPDGEKSWYWDSPLNKNVRYETFISSELVSYVDCRYSTVANRHARAITGLSMGGQGALFNAIRHKEVFGAAGSTSGGVDIRPFPNNWEMAKQLGALATNKDVWDEYAVVNQIARLQKGDLALIIDCGEGDFFLEVNKDLHKRLLQQGIDHDFITAPGEHNWKYWRNSMDYQILFLSKFFERY